MPKTEQGGPGRGGSGAGAAPFFVDIEVRAQPNDGAVRQLRALVDPGSRFTWLPGSMLEDLGIIRRQPITFVTPDGGQISRVAGYAFITSAGAQTMATIVFGEPGDPAILGAHTIAGLNVDPDPPGKRLVPGKPLRAPSTLKRPDTA